MFSLLDTHAEKHRTGRYGPRLFWRALAFAVLALAVSSLPAFAFETVVPAAPPVKAATSVPAAADPCLPFLSPVRYALAPAPADTPVRDYRVTGGAAALGLVVGLRFALGPKELTRGSHHRAPTLGFWQPDSGTGAQALAVADYRRCKSEAALNALSDWRWER